MKKIIVIGAGAAGMMAALTAARAGAAVTILEKNEKAGKKVYITGKGRCNVTNAGDRDDFFANIISNPRFLYSSFSSFNNYDMMDLLAGRGLALKTERGNRVFPVSDKSSDVIRTLTGALTSAGVQIRLRTEVKELVIRDGICTGVKLTNGRTETADAVIVATGGCSYPLTGSTGDGYLFAEQAGHGVRERYPALVPFNAHLDKNIPCSTLMGLTVKNAGLKVLRGKKTVREDFGELLFTHFGVSGPMILSAASVLTAYLNGGGEEKITLKLDLKPALSEKQLEARFIRDFSEEPGKQLSNLLRKAFPASLVPVMLSLSDIRPERKGAEVTKEERARLIRNTKSMNIHVDGTRGFAEAIVTQGGVEVKKIDPHTMESKLVKNLYFAGEVLDLDAFTGGYNLQIAWTTGHAAGTAAAKEEQ